MITEAYLRDGDKLKLGDQVTTNWHKDCEGKIFVIFEMNEDHCESGVMVLVHLKGDPERILKGSTGLGLDTNHFKKALLL